MNKAIITIESLTYGMKAKKLLSKSGIHSKLVKIDSYGLNKGCRYALEISTDNFILATNILKSNHFDFGVL